MQGSFLGLRQHSNERELMPAASSLAAIMKALTGPAAAWPVERMSSTSTDATATRRAAQPDPARAGLIGLINTRAQVAGAQPEHRRTMSAGVPPPVVEQVKSAAVLNVCRR
jgi:hypothetical protein